MIELSHNRFKIQEFTIDCLNMTIENHEQSIKLPVKVFEFFKLFLMNENRTVERAQAIEIIWQGNEGVGKRGYVNSMWQIRKAFTDLGANCDEIFVTLPKVGYYLAITPEGIDDPKKVKKHNRLYLIITLLLIFISLITFYLYQKDEQPQVATNIQPTLLESQTNYQGIEEQPAISHDGNYLAFSWSQENKFAKIHIKNLKEPNVPLTLVSSNKFDEISPAWSADDQSLAYARIDSGQCEIRVIHLPTNEDRLIDKGCSYSTFWNIVDWSNDGLHLIYPKKINNTVAIFKYNFANNSITQISYPPKNSADIMAVWSNNNEDIAIVRKSQLQYKINLLSKNGDETTLLENKNSISGITWDHNQNLIYVTYLHQGRYFIYQIDVDTKEKTQIRSIKGASNLSFNSVTNELFLTQHLLNEYIVQHSLIDNRIIRRASSSSRDMYGEYVANTANIIFTSNRSNNWDLWLKTDKGTTNLTKGMGAVATSAVSPDNKFFTVTMIEEGQNQQLFLGTFTDGEILHLNTPKLIPEFSSWSSDGQRIYFSAELDDKSGIYQYNLNTQEVEQITSTNEVYAVEGKNGDLYVTRSLQNGIWKFNQKTNEFTKIIHDLAPVDLAGYFWENDTIYYISRTKENDLVLKYNESGDDETVATYPINSIRKYKGIAKADHESFIITLKSIYDADIYSMKIQ